MKNHRSSDHTIATATRVILLLAGIGAGIMVVSSLPEIARYVKIKRM